jgi:hypothetical protein
MPHLWFPTAVVSCILVDEHERFSGTRGLVIKLDTIIGGGVRHDCDPSRKFNRLYR